MLVGTFNLFHQFEILGTESKLNYFNEVPFLIIIIIIRGGEVGEEKFEGVYVQYLVCPFVIKKKMEKGWDINQKCRLSINMAN